MLSTAQPDAQRTAPDVRRVVREIQSLLRSVSAAGDIIDAAGLPSPPPTPNWQSSSGSTARAAPPTRSPTTRHTRTDAPGRLDRGEAGGTRWVRSSRAGTSWSTRSGAAASGAVWRAWDHRRRRYVAAKVLQQSDAHTLLRFVREQALRIDHPQCWPRRAGRPTTTRCCSPWTWCSGGSLAHVIGDYGPLPPRFVCVLLDQLLSGLAAVHAEGVVHRDIKPANILMEATGTGRPHLRLSDFGISMRKGEPRLTETNYVVGTPGYFAPEQMLGAEPDFPADLFAVGLVALYLLRGSKPDAQALVEHFAGARHPAGARRAYRSRCGRSSPALLQPDPHAGSGPPQGRARRFRPPWSCCRSRRPARSRWRSSTRSARCPPASARRGR